MCVVGSASLKSYRSATTLCVPDLVFNDISRHKILLPEGTPVQREILTGKSSSIEQNSYDIFAALFTVFSDESSFVLLLLMAKNI